MELFNQETLHAIAQFVMIIFCLAMELLGIVMLISIVKSPSIVMASSCLIGGLCTMYCGATLWRKFHLSMK
ncbi:MAG: hypothetical protein Q8Q23_02445 [bacterium]|nr:hypothetical protein [bacterium]